MEPIITIFFWSLKFSNIFFHFTWLGTSVVFGQNFLGPRMFFCQKIIILRSQKIAL